MGAASLGMVAGGALWAVYGVFEMLKPWGVAEVYRPDLGYELITDRALYTLYGLPGTAALVLGGLGVRALARGRAGRLVALGRSFAYGSVAAGVLSGVGLAIGSAPLFFGPIALGMLVLGAAACFASAGARGPDRVVLLLTGALGLFTLALRPLVYAVGVIPPAGGAAAIALFGLGWVALGLRGGRPRA